MKVLSTKMPNLPSILLFAGGLSLAAMAGCASNAPSTNGGPSETSGSASSSGTEGSAEAGGSSGGSEPSSGSSPSSTGSSSGSSTPIGNPGSSGTGSDDAGTVDEGGPDDAAPPSGEGGPTTPPTTAGGPTMLPSAMGTCPKFVNGQAAMIGRMPVTIYIDPNAKSKPAPGGPLILYYHATASSPIEVLSGFGQANIDKVTSMGGVVAAFKSTSCPGCQTTDDNYWYVQDGPIQDTLVACAIQQANIDTRHIHALGWSAGALHTMWVAFARSNYMASVVSYSGGLDIPTTPQDPTNKVPAILTYGDKGSDVVILDFNQSSNTYYTTYSPKGYYTMMCHHPGGHEVDPTVAPLTLGFFMDHPYKVSPEPYATTIPSRYPSYCHNMPM